ncbi:MAG: BACON domain-containing protein [Lachnospira sp.]
MIMNRKHLLKIGKTALGIVLCNLLCWSCSQDSAFQEEQLETKTVNVYFDCTKMSFDGGTTRASNMTRSSNSDYTTWKDNDVVYIYFGNSNYAIATYTLENGWTASIVGDLPASGTCYCRHYANAVSYQSANTIAVLNNKSIDYIAENVAYTNNNNNGLYLIATMHPNCVRIRFKGTPNQAVSLSGFDTPARFSAIDEKLTSSSATSNLVVEEDGYTPYVYGYLSNSTELTITVDGKNYSKKVTGNELPTGKSGYIDLSELNSDNPSVILELKLEDFSSDNSLDASQYSLELSVASLSFSSKTSTKTFDVTSTDSWVISSLPSWCTATPTSASGNATVSISVSDNKNTDSRNGDLVITGTKSNLQRTIHIVQEAGGETEINRDDYPDSDKKLD